MKIITSELGCQITENKLGFCYCYVILQDPIIDITRKDLNNDIYFYNVSFSRSYICTSCMFAMLVVHY